jgi:DNA-directed RNA polymerase subunit N
MLIPIRCFACGKVLADKWEAYEKRCREADAKQDGKQATDAQDLKTPRGKILDEMGITQGCCRTVMLTCVKLANNI